MNMTTKEKVKEKILKQVNSTGFLLQERCLHDIRAMDDPDGYRFYADLEEPFTFPGSTEATKGDPGAVDVRAVSYGITPSHQPIVYIVECKRSLPGESYWVFFTKKEQYESPIFYQYKIAPPIADGHSLKWHPSTNTNISFPSLNIRMPVDFNLAYSGIELNEKFEGTNVTDGEKMNKPMRQVIRGTLATTDNKQFRETVGRRIDSGFESILFMPVVVTTAQLYLADYQREHIDLSTGTIVTRKVEFRPVNVAAFQFPLPDYYHQFAGPRHPDEGRKPRPDFLTVMVVNAAYLPEFINLTKSGATYAIE